MSLTFDFQPNAAPLATTERDRLLGESFLVGQRQNVVGGRDIDAGSGDEGE